MNAKIGLNGKISVETPLSKAGEIMFKSLMDITLGVAAFRKANSTAENVRL